MGETIEKRWTWHFPGPVMAVWRIMADTARFNEAAGFPKHEIEEVRQPDGTIHYIGRAKVGPFKLVWRDIPIDWVEGERFTHCNEFTKGPIKRLCVTLRLIPEEDGTRGEYLLEIEPRNLFGNLLAPRLIKAADKKYAALIAQVQAYISGETDTIYAVGDDVLTDEARSRLKHAVGRVEESGGGHGLAARIAGHISHAQEVDLMHMRPLALARAWEVPERHAVEAFLESVRAGLLGMDWHILCPRCRGAKASAATLDQLPTEAHCASCNVDYQRDFAKNVELTFHPSAAIRPIGHGEFCLFGPMSTPHVKLQQHIEPGETLKAMLCLEPGAYRYRTLNGSGEADFEFKRGGLPALKIMNGRIRTGAPGAPGEIEMSNGRKQPEIAVIESREWIRDALTAHRVTSMQRFRDLFSSQVLRPGDEVAVERIALMFTDLKGSTSLYDRIGDAAAYRLVREHFAYLAEKIREHEGAIVKTIGDAVMAAFANPADALRAAVAVQRNVAAFNAAQDGADISIKLGLHEGPAIAVTLNDRLDYFGSTVNLASRLEGESRGGDIVLSQAVAKDPGVVEQLRDLRPETESARFKGYSKPVSYQRLKIPSRAR